ncbi:MAG: DUF4416 family protein [Deltaproteobacteria bacterium]|nr:DUF4416 family protein [Deltaproteobacteria bacterium]
MGIPREPKPAKYFVALLSSDTELLTAVEKDLSTILGAVDARSEVWAWTVSNFYEKEMGAGLRRRFLAFEPLASPGDLARIKLLTQQVEDKYRDTTEKRRPAHLPPLRYLRGNDAPVFRRRVPRSGAHLPGLPVAADARVLHFAPFGVPRSASSTWLIAESRLELTVPV